MTNLDLSWVKTLWLQNSQFSKITIKDPAWSFSLGLWSYLTRKHKFFRWCSTWPLFNLIFKWPKKLTAFASNLGGWRILSSRKNLVFQQKPKYRTGHFSPKVLWTKIPKLLTAKIFFSINWELLHQTCCLGHLWDSEKKIVMEIEN